ncbi:MAG: hypothetical protein QOJ27_1889, partial [Sphingomonadales bacterium]|nr:hypothetical protein [Sphingomonadales bacterium]
MKHLIVIGGGFAGVRAAQAAAAEARAAGASLVITLVSETDRLTLRPRLYKAEPETWELPLRPALEPLGINLLVGRATQVDTVCRQVAVDRRRHPPSTIGYDVAVIAAGSRLQPPAVPGLNDNVLDVDTAAGARRLLKHLSRLQIGPGCSTFVILGAGFTGLELATELRGTLAQLHGPGFAEAARILLVDPNPAAPELGERPRRTLEHAMAAARIETRFGR